MDNATMISACAIKKKYINILKNIYFVDKLMETMGEINSKSGT